MNSIRQLFRRPWKTLLGLLLSLLACAMICVCIGQFLAAVQTQANVERTYTTVGLLTSKYMSEKIYDEETLEDEEPESIGVTYLSEQPLEVQDFLQELSTPDTPGFVKRVQQNLRTSGYAPDLNPLNHYGIGTLPVGLDDHVDGTNNVKLTPYTYAMFVVKIEEVGDVHLCIDHDETSKVNEILNLGDVSAYGYAIDLTGEILETRSLQQGYVDPTGRTIHVAVSFATEEEAVAWDVQPGQIYLLCGADYKDNDMNLRFQIANFFEMEPAELDWANVRMLTEEEKSRYNFETEALYEEEDGSGLFLDAYKIQMIDSCSMTVCTDPMLRHGAVGQAEVMTPNGMLSADEYISRYQDSNLVLLDGTADSFLAQNDDPFWEQWLETAKVNDHSFPILGVEDLNAVAQFAIQDAMIVEGRGFTQADADAKLCVLSESLAVANGLSIGDRISLQFYGADPEIDTSIQQANPSSAYYSPAMGFSGEAESYEIVGFYRQKNQWAEGTYCFTPNTIFVPKAAASSDASSICGGIYTSVVLENGTIPQMEQLATERGFEGLFAFYDQGYSQIMESLQGYYEVGHVVLRTGIALWIGIALVFLFLFPYQLRPDLTRMWDLGTPPAKIRRHVLASSFGLLLPGAVLGCVTSALLFHRMTQYLVATTETDLMLDVNPGTLGLVAAAQLLALLGLVYAIACILTAQLKKCSRRKLLR